VARLRTPRVSPRRNYKFHGEFFEGKERWGTLGGYAAEVTDERTNERKDKMMDSIIA